MFAISRALQGAAVSVSLGIGPLFITECRYNLFVLFLTNLSSPLSCRGVISLATGLMVQTAVTVGAIVAMPQV